MRKFSFSEDEYSPFNSLQDKINKLLIVSKHEERMDRSIAICDKFENYMKNIDKLNQMINEFKGLVSIIRAERNCIDKESKKIRQQFKKMLEILSGE